MAILHRCTVHFIKFINNYVAQYACINVCHSHAVRPSIVEQPVMQSVYPGVSVDFSCRAKGFSNLSYSWFVVASGDNNGTQIMNENAMTYTIADPMYGQNATGYYCIVINREGISVSSTSMLIGNKYCVTVIR